MMKKESYEKRLAAYIVIEFVIFCAIKIAEQTAKPWILHLFMYSAIFLNLIVIIYACSKFNSQMPEINKKNISVWGIPLALLLTACADVFLVLIGGKELLVFGYLFFALVQTVYAFYLKMTPLIGGIRIVAYILLLGVLYACGKLSLPYAIAAWSMTQLVINMIIAWIYYIKEKSCKSLLFATGMTLFLGCDGSIMIRTLFADSSTVSVTVFYHVICLLVWTCYVPSQVAITTSYIVDRKERSFEA
ncbi:MAG: hypothetical protein NC231_13190 [Bacillus sp. (in: Bacteria)]|nr:hypothetical protein [Bacillus sp. (in: firmicutes)]MCM1426385.1 hypothetical protein [Eubacterium sp.]